MSTYVYSGQSTLFPAIPYKKEGNTVVLLTGSFSQSYTQCSQHYWITFFPKESVYEAENDQHFQELTMYVPQRRKNITVKFWFTEILKTGSNQWKWDALLSSCFSMQARSIVPQNITQLKTGDYQGW